MVASASGPIAPPIPTPSATPVSVFNNPAFALDGSIDSSNQFPAVSDWVNLNCPSSPAPNPTPAASTGVVPYAQTIYTQGGSKDIYDINASTSSTNWLWTIGSVPDKDTLANAYAAQYSISKADGTSDTLLYVGGEREANNGDAFIGVWFFQEAVLPVPGSPGTFRSGNTTADPLAQHKFGDILILSDFTVGGSSAAPKVFKWVAPCTDDTTAFPPVVVGNCPIAGRTARGAVISNCQKGGTLCDITPPAPTAGSSVLTLGIQNSVPLTIPAACQTTWQFTSKTGTPTGTIDTNEFFEVGINLTGLGLGGECFPTFLVETRSAQSVDAQLKAFVLHSFENCGVSCEKSVSPTTICQGSPATYTYGADNPFPVSLSATIRDDEGTPNDTSDDKYISGLGPPDATTGLFPACTVTTNSVANSIPAGTLTGQLGCTRSVSNLPVGTRTNISHTIATTPQGTVLADCTATATVTVLANPTVTVNSPSVCAGSSATITATPSPAGTYTYNWTVPSGVTNPGNVASFSASVAGTYTVLITDGSGCTGTNSGTLTVTPNPTVSVNSATVCDGSSATITATPSPAGSYNYVWTGPFNATHPNPGNVASFSAFIAGTYGVTITETGGNHCTGTNSGTLTVEPNPTVSIAGDETCSTDNILTLTTTVLGGSGTITYSWTVPSGVTNPGNASSCNATAPGNYAVHVTRGVASCPGDAHLHVGLCAGTSTPGPLP